MDKNPAECYVAPALCLDDNRNHNELKTYDRLNENNDVRILGERYYKGND